MLFCDSKKKLIIQTIAKIKEMFISAQKCLHFSEIKFLDLNFFPKFALTCAILCYCGKISISYFVLLKKNYKDR